MTVKILAGDCLAILPTIPDNSIDAICCDPPYHLHNMTNRTGTPKNGKDGSYKRLERGFMGTKWDGGDIAFRVEVWQECLRVLKPGGYMVAFASCRGYHRMVVAIEDAGFLIHPFLAFVFGSGFPKAADVSKAIDRHLGAERQVVGVNKGAGMSISTDDDYVGFQRRPAQQHYTSDVPITAAATPEAAQWEGWAYGLQALKPALEPICLAQKPMEGTGAQNILKWGVGALNIDACRIPGGDPANINRFGKNYGAAESDTFGQVKHAVVGGSSLGRWPANLITDGSDEVEAAFAQFGQSKSKAGRYRAPGKKAHNSKLGGGVDRSMLPDREDWHEGYGDSGTPSRFFYAAKANKKDRCGSKHPTVKPIALMEYLCKLICPPGGTILDPFAGSGTTGEAACSLGFNAILIERELQYVQDCERRLALYLEDVR